MLADSYQSLAGEISGSAQFAAHEFHRKNPFHSCLHFIGLENKCIMYSRGDGENNAVFP